MSSISVTVDVRRAADRTMTKTSWLESRHSFSFGDHYDPGNTHHGLLLVNNDDIVAPGTGFEPHPHRDVEIVTCVLQGSLTHRDSLGNSGVLYPGLAQRMSAGSGILHSEKNDSATAPVHFVQMWLAPDVPGISPGYQQHDIDDDLLDGRMVTIASGMSGHEAAVTINNRHAALHGSRLRPGDDLELPLAAYLHLFVARGRLIVAGVGELSAGDAVRFARSQGRLLTAIEPSEILVWEMHVGLGG